MTIIEILADIFSGKRVHLSFSSAKEREQFRQRLYKTKKIEDKVLQDILEQDRKTMRFQVIDKVTVDTEKEDICEEKFEAKIWLEQKPSEQYQIISVLDESEQDQSERTNGSGNSNVSGSLGEDNLKPQKAS